jgi:hypothetical protein
MRSDTRITQVVAPLARDGRSITGGDDWLRWTRALVAAALQGMRKRDEGTSVTTSSP